MPLDGDDNNDNNDSDDTLDAVAIKEKEAADGQDDRVWHQERSPDKASDTSSLSRLGASLARRQLSALPLSTEGIVKGQL
ncbi:hypothetical protein ISF_04646 [Cordyceps fumosorosea ARSEF 2679]|uniref:Uncharacterized protein n=1 Tax=Cordyceps fumosorosea (strain ARSEF 2679) TaxID=1081104 RepID=A0A167WLH0_CORFA|nr:hypothetical protein ISF_04646 [Cordyceps fumosorosea ARSEF 2679]OAA63937.1 hypothetical protein ISF_04646 [Cordyceps fumosorosea ARSEF 2679]